MVKYILIYRYYTTRFLIIFFFILPVPTASPGDERYATPPRQQATETPVSATTGMCAFGDGEGMIRTVSV